MSKHLSDVSSIYGAPMGRRETRGDRGFTGKLSLQRIRLNQGGYDSGGAYWGIGQPLYWFGSEDGGIEEYIRASDREDAKAQILARYPGARFYR